MLGYSVLDTMMASLFAVGVVGFVGYMIWEVPRIKPVKRKQEHPGDDGTGASER